MFMTANFSVRLLMVCENLLNQPQRFISYQQATS